MQTVEAPWPSFQYDAANTGQNPYPGTVDDSLRWRKEGYRYPFLIPAVSADGTIYVIPDKSYAFRPDGTVKGSLSKFGDTYNSSPVGSNNTIYFGSDDTIHFGTDGRDFYAVGSDRFTDLSQSRLLPDNFTLDENVPNSFN